MATRTASRSRQTERITRGFLRLHAAYERRFARAVAAFFREQGQRLIQALAGVGSVQPTDVAAALDWDAEHRTFIRDVARPQLLAITTAGAVYESRVARAGKSLARATLTSQKAADDDDEIDGELPEDVRAAIRQVVEDTLHQEYWRKIQDDTREVIENAINNALDNQFIDEARLGKLIERATSGEIAKHRAKRIARTETTGAMNAGHVAVLDDLADEGLAAGKEWVAVIDADTRESHEELNGKHVGPHKDFHVGPSGSPAPYPGYFGLPAEERINCRCTIVGSRAGEGGE
jgi:hypothetical protein